MSTTNARSPKKGARTPVQQRGIETRRRLVEAGEKVFAKHGYHNVIADEIAKEAGVSVGSFYAYFNNKRDLFLEIIDEYTANGVKAMSKSLDSFPKNKSRRLEQNIRKMIVTLIAMHRESPELISESLQMAISDDEIRKRVERISGIARQLFCEALATVNKNLKRKDRESIAYMLYYASEGVVHRMTLNEDDIDEKKVVRELSKMVASYISEKL